MRKRAFVLVSLILGLFYAFTGGFTENMTEVALGEKLFFDPLLSSSQKISCSSCHNPKFAFADSVALSLGIEGKKGNRNTPSVMNMSARPYFFYDGRVGTLEAQIFHPIQNPLEMNMSRKEVEQRLNKHTLYVSWFQAVYHQKPDSALVSKAIATYIKTLESPGDASNDLWVTETDLQAMTASQIRGRTLFMGKAKCFDCHFSPDFTGDEFRNIGLYDGKTLNDPGRYTITHDSSDLGRFKVPSLRNIAITAPYMHNGMFKTLEEVMEFYDNPQKIVPHALNVDTLLQKPLNLTEQEETDIIEFLKALTDRQFMN